MTPSQTDLSNAVRFLSCEAVQQANSGHPGMPMGIADVATVLFTRFLKYDAANPAWPDRDRFVLSAGHGSALLYSLFYLTGYPEMTLDEIKNFRQLGSKTPGHPEYGHTPGVETTTGPLGQGITTAVGMALAERMTNVRYGDDLVDHFTYVIVGDGCLMEGVSHEAISFAGHQKLNKLIVLWDDNNISIDGTIDVTCSDDQMKRFEAAGWDTQAVDGHDQDAVAAAIEKAQKSDKPSMIACKTTIAFGSPSKAGSNGAHGSPLGWEDIAAAKKALGFDYPAFEIPEEVLTAWREAGAKGAADREAWEGRLSASGKADDFNAFTAGKLPEGWKDALEAYKKTLADEKPTLATRASSGKALEVLTEAIPQMIGGSADLTGSVNTLTKANKAPLNAENYGGRYVHYGIREFAMGAIMNGMALHGGFIPYGGTFLMFVDYMKGAMRLSALMGTKVVYVLTHDSIGVGEDGPTHQPVETLASIRSIPNLNVFRPADAMEMAECWELAITADCPSGMVCSRQNLPTVRETYSAENLSAKGGYVLAEAEGGARQVTLMATGSEVHLCVEARQRLQAEGIPTAVVSLPCWELFEAQGQDYMNEVLGPGTARVAVEAAVSFGWGQYLGEKGAFVGMKGFGTSMPGGKIFEHFGITTDNVVTAAKSLI